MTRALPFTRIRTTQDAAHLVFAFTRLLGGDDDNDETSTSRARTVAADFSAYFNGIANISGCLPGKNHTRDVQACLIPAVSPLIRVSGCLSAVTQGMMRFAADFTPIYTRNKALITCLKISVIAMRGAYRCTAPEILPATAYLRCVHTYISTAAAHRNCKNIRVGLSNAAAACLRKYTTPSSKRDHDRFTPYSAARVVPCEYYPIPVPPPTPPVILRPCGERPPSNRLPLAFVRRRIEQDSAQLPLPFACFYRTPIPVKRSYIMTHTITATLDGTTSLELISASFTTDMSGFCWQGQITLYPDDFAKINIDNRAAGNEAQLDVTIDGHRFRFIAEDYSDNRAFGRKTYTVTGRSTTAKLSTDYAKTHNGTIDSDLYARQIADQQLAMLDQYKITVWQTEDWLVPAGSYTLTDKTPIDVIMDIAHAAGGFVESHIAEPWLMIKPRWPSPAWGLDAAAPHITIPESVIISISGQKRVSTRCNGVMVMADHTGGKGADVYREGTDRTPRASALSHPLYTDLPAHRAAGIAALSDTGRHKMETVRLPLADDYGLPPVRLGQIVQINDSSGYWRGVVTAVMLEVEIQNDVPSVIQSITLDRYMDE